MSFINDIVDFFIDRPPKGLRKGNIVTPRFKDPHQYEGVKPLDASRSYTIKRTEQQILYKNEFREKNEHKWVIYLKEVENEKVVSKYFKHPQEPGYFSSYFLEDELCENNKNKK